MCGILGMMSVHPISELEFNAKLSLLSHRGPDDKGTYFHENIAFGQTRLSILDLSTDGHQPMKSTCENYIITFNGEIYNFKEIREELELKGYRFSSSSDTEVILQGFIEYGEGIVAKLNGMFAFAIYDKRERSIFLARDHTGMKPLYYYSNGSQFIFSSELKPLKAYASGLDINAKILYLLLGYVPEPYNILKGIKTFPSGSYGYLIKNRLETIKFYEYDYDVAPSKEYPEIVKDVERLLDNAVRRHLVSDAPIGTFLSGGLDSSAITALAARYKKDLKTVSLVFDDKNLSEDYYQDLMVDMYKTDHTKCLIDENVFLEGVHDFLEAMEQPSIDGLNTYFVAKAAKKSGLTTVLSGVGGDEIFYGYPSFKTAKPLQLLSNIPYALIKPFENFGKLQKLSLLKAQSDLAYYLPKRGLFTPHEIASYLDIDIGLIFSLLTNLWESYNSSQISNLPDKISYFELDLYMKNQLLRDSDLFAMTHSLEIRIPLLDKELLNYILKVPHKYKFGKFNKQLFVDSVKNIIPKEIIERPKMGFSLPFERWFRKNIDEFGVSTQMKADFMSGKLPWSKVWAVMIDEKFQL